MRVNLKILKVSRGVVNLMTFYALSLPSSIRVSLCFSNIRIDRVFIGKIRILIRAQNPYNTLDMNEI